jgi:hypothetical protein
MGVLVCDVFIRLPQMKHSAKVFSMLNKILHIAIFILVTASPITHAQTANVSDTRAQFFNTLKKLCGTTFEGKMTFPVDGRDDFAGKLLVAKVATCTDNEIRVPFSVGNDRSRTWIFTRTGDSLELKHDHRHTDGKPDEVTMYGGMASLEGTARVQSFAADAYTAKLIPAAATNVWTISLSADGTTLTYHLTRDQQPRFTAVLTLAKRVGGLKY